MSSLNDRKAIRLRTTKRGRPSTSLAVLLALVQQTHLTSQQAHLVRLEQQPIDLQIVLVVLRARVGRVRIADDRIAVVHDLLAQQTLTERLIVCTAVRLIGQAECAQFGLVAVACGLQTIGADRIQMKVLDLLRQRKALRLLVLNR